MSIFHHHHVCVLENGVVERSKVAWYRLLCTDGCVVSRPCVGMLDTIIYTIRMLCFQDAGFLLGGGGRAFAPP